jgi:hypothetical protein
MTIAVDAGAAFPLTIFVIIGAMTVTEWLRDLLRHGLRRR